MNGDDSPICKLQVDREGFRRLLARAINKNQMLILSQTDSAFGETITSLLNKTSRQTKVPISTLKLNAKILRELGLISFGNALNFRPAELTETGKFVLEIMGDDENGA